MSSDRARISYDPTRQYRSVVAQQGRVTLEADVNEAQEIAGDLLRLETIDVVGASGTPDDGYKVAAITGNTTHDFTVGPGTMYVGGERVTLPPDVTYAKQPEWLDRTGDPLWVDPQQVKDGSELVYLMLREQEVSAVEDTALREVALGGPDTAQRKRLVQRIVRLPVSGNTCASALQEAQADWSAQGGNFDPATMMLKSPATLKVGLVNPPTPATVCEPQAQGGYIGADNQLIRVQIVSCAADGKGGTLAWGYNNASFLHRAKLIQSNAQSIVELMTTPVDAYHAPRANHPVEVLRCAVPLSDDPAIDPLNRDYVAAHCGTFVTPTDDYQIDSHQLVLPANIPATGGQPLFLRLWEEELTFVSGQPVTLSGTGLQVTVDFGGKAGSFTVGQFWMFAARPNTPAEVYPHRYLFAPQPPEGPRLWVCSLATIGWDKGVLSLIDDCRNPFDNLVELTKRHVGCCGVVISPADVGGGAKLQELIDKLIRQKPANKATLSLLPGKYVLPRPLVFGTEHSGLTLEGCRDGAVLTAKPGAEDAFRLGLVQLLLAKDVTLRVLEFATPMTVVDTGTTPPRVDLSIGVLGIDCADLRVEQCLFDVPTKSELPLYATGIYLAGLCPNLAIERNRFVVTQAYSRAKPPQRVTSGLVAAPGFPITNLQGLRTMKAGASADAAAVLLDNTRITGNEFTGLTMAVYVRAETGRVFCDDNVVKDCDGGFYFSNTDLSLARQTLTDAMRATYKSDTERAALVGDLQAAQVPMHAAMYDFATYVPLPADYAPTYTSKFTQPATDTMAMRAAQAAAAGAAGDAKAANASATTTKAAAQSVNFLTADAMSMAWAPYLAAPAAPPTGLISHLRVADNDVELLAIDPHQTSDGLNGIKPLALYVGMPAQAGASTAVSDNCLRGNSPNSFLAIVQAPGVLTVADNMILNAASRQMKGLSLKATIGAEPPLMQVNGNCFLGSTSIEPGPKGAGCQAGSWADLNSTQN